MRRVTVEPHPLHVFPTTSSPGRLDSCTRDRCLGTALVQESRRAQALVAFRRFVLIAPIEEAQWSRRSPRMAVRHEPRRWSQRGQLTLTPLSEHHHGSTVKSAVIPAYRWSFTWQWNIHVPGSSGTMSAVSMLIGRSSTMSIRIPMYSTVCPCQCGV